MFDLHIKGGNFGIMPTIFGIPSYAVFVGLGIAGGIGYYIWDSGKRHGRSEGVIDIVAAALIFGAIGSKVPLILEGAGLEAILFGKSIVGGLVGGMLGVVAVKRCMGIRTRMGNVIAPSVALGMAIGRLGCFFNGCCYGIESSWGFDFGDGVLRYPTQLFESTFHLVAFIVLHVLRTRVKTPGILFKAYVLAYFVYRFLTEFIRENPEYMLGLTVYQVISALGAIYVVLALVGLRLKEANQNRER